MFSLICYDFYIDDDDDVSCGYFLKKDRVWGRDFFFRVVVFLVVTIRQKIGLPSLTVGAKTCSHFYRILVFKRRVSKFMYSYLLNIQLCYKD